MGKPTDKSGNENYVRGRSDGVSDTYGTSRKGVAEKTVISAEGSNDGGGEGALKSAAASVYRKAVENKGGDQGDRALRER